MRMLFLGAVLLLCSGCKKQGAVFPPVAFAQDASGFVKYAINAGAHYADQHPYRPVALHALHFVARFDSTAVYQTRAAENQYDINKLYGFADNGMEHHQYSARFGWRWSDGALRLFAYVYNDGKVASEELGVVPIGVDIRCGIEVEAGSYRFYSGEYRLTLPRKSTTATANGYLLYPYFGGDETAPHTIRIWIQQLPQP